MIEIDFKLVLKNFYNVQKISFSDITEEKIDEIKKTAKKLNIRYRNLFRLTKIEKYTRIMEIIQANHSTNKKQSNSEFATTSVSEKLLLFMFSIDPNFEVIKICNSYDSNDDIKMQFIKQFGLYDKNLIIIENYFLKHFMNIEKKEEINNEIQKKSIK